MDIANAVRKRLRIHILEEVAGGAGCHGGKDLGVVREARQHEHARTRCGLENPAYRADAVAPRHDQIEEHDVGRQRCGNLYRVVRAFSLADNVDALLQTEEGAQTLSNH